ncbi:glycerol uptake facilitator protein [Companilactobacillus sp. RD055328]|uniref:MIP/aquaporin family protein n=1 Tax=Companilactobacillus sp. RD055328 TaxID=2916634 RepID=UPI001FC7D76F|nr:MIP/aquaporin family protein [Companilactobacillus sp. RD055328]GKQ42405.1 glycerol uptake facilitator protein [Companilactobacillus sp. RD055328]
MSNLLISETIGTAILVLLGDGVVAGVSLKKSKSEGAGWVAITLGWGFAVAMAVYIGVNLFHGPAHFNPAVTLGMAMAGMFPWSDVMPVIIAQMIGAFIGAILVWIQYFPHWKDTKDQAAILGTFATGPAIRSYGANLMSEIIGTFVLVYTIMAIGQGNIADGLNPLIVGTLIIAIGLSLGGTTGYAINPARDLGPRLAHAVLPIANKGKSDWAYSWVPVVGPMIGGALAAGLFLMFK